METTNTYTAFDGTKLFSQGPLSEVVLKIKKQLGKSDHTAILIFSDATGKTIDFNFQGGEKDVLKRLEVFVSDENPKEENPGPGRPKLGVVSREVSLLPRHWEWLATQPGGASGTLRKLVEEAKKKTMGPGSIKQIQEKTHKFLSTMAGDLENYEEALRALYRKDKKSFLSCIQDWPTDIKKYTVDLVKAVWES